MVQVFRASELPPDIPGMVITDGPHMAVLINPSYAAECGTTASRSLTNALLAAADTAGERPMRDVV